MSRLVTIVIPTFREDEIAVTLARLAEGLQSVQSTRFEVVVVDDTGESERAAMRAWGANNAADGLTVVVLEGPARGKGAAVRAGIAASQGEVVFTVDADLPVTLDHLASFLALIDSGADVVMAERPMTRNLRSPLRFVLSRGLWAFQRFVVFGADLFEDTQCGFKAFRGELARALAREQMTDGGMVDIEYLFLARRAGARIDRVAVEPAPEWRPSKINAWKAMRRDPADLLRLRWRAIRGAYRS